MNSIYNFSDLSCVFCIFVSFLLNYQFLFETLARCGKQREGEIRRETKSCSQGACKRRGGVAHTVRSKERRNLFKLGIVGYIA